MAEDLEQAFDRIKKQLKSRLLDAISSVKDLTLDPEEYGRRMKAAQEEVDKAGQEARDALNTLRDTLHP